MLALEIISDIFNVIKAPFQFIFDTFPDLYTPFTCIFVVSLGYHAWRALK